MTRRYRIHSIAAARVVTICSENMPWDGTPGPVRHLGAEPVDDVTENAHKMRCKFCKATWEEQFRALDVVIK